MASKLNFNERSWAIQLIQEISFYVKNKPDFKIKTAGGETTVNSGKNVMFPDILLFGDEGQSLVLQGWEIKMPDVPIDDMAFVADAFRKADNLALNSTVLWNFRYAVFYVKDSVSGIFKPAKKWDNSSFISSDRTDVELYRQDWTQTLHEVIDEVNRFLVLGYFRPVNVGEQFADSMLESFIKGNKKSVAESLKELSKRDSFAANFIDLWFDNASAEYVKDEKDPFCAYAKVILLDWVNKILFAHILRPHFPAAEKITDLSSKQNPSQAMDIFRQITLKCDFYSVFREITLEENIPEIVWEQIKEINSLLCRTKITSVNQRDMQTLLENSVKTSQRVITGLFTTDPHLADFLVRIAVENVKDAVIDPCCGTGTFVRAAVNYKMERGLSADEAYKTVFASDRQAFPLQISGLSMLSSDTVNIPEIIFQKNVFDIRTGDKIDIVNPENGDTLNINIPLFDAVISNLPFVDFCRNNTKNADDIKHKKRISLSIKEKTDIALSDRSDYYMYIILHIWNMLKNGGTACVIVSNSWMSTAAGGIFFKILNRFFHICGIIKSGGARWFKNAKIITTVLLLKKKEDYRHESGGNICFYMLKKELCELSDRKIMNIAAGTILQNKEINTDVMARREYSKKEISELEQLNISYNAFFYDISWLNEIKEKLTHIKQRFTVFSGAKTGQDEIFILQDKNAVDIPYLFNMLRNSKSCESLIAVPDSCFVYSDKTYEELIKLGHNKTADYYKSFEDSLNKSVLQHGKIWYHLKETTKKAHIVTGLNPDKRFFFSKFNEPACINQRLIGFILRNAKLDIDICHALLNSLIGIFFIEASGFGRGDGVLDLSKDKLESSFMLNPDIISAENKKNILKAFSVLKQRKILPIEQELEMPDRIKFDYEVLKAYNICGLYGRIKQSFLEMVSTRRSAGSVFRE